MTKPEKPDPDPAAMIDTAVRRHGWRKLARETDPLGPPERIEDYAETGLAIDAMNRERLALRAKWAEEERQRKAEDAAAKAEEERLLREQQDKDKRYGDLVAAADLPSQALAFDIGTGTGVLACVLAKRGVQRKLRRYRFA